MTRIFLVLSIAVSLSAQTAHVTTVAGVPGVAGNLDGSTAVALLNRPTWLDVIRDNDTCVAGRAGDVLVVDRANQSVRWISGGAVKTLKIATSFQNSSPFPFDFGGPFGGGIAVEPAGAGCGCGPYARGVWVATSASRQLLLASMDGLPAARDDIAPLIGLRGELTMPTGVALSKRYTNIESELNKRFLFIADTGDQTIRRVRFQWSFEACPQHRFIETYAGASGVAGWQDGLAANARFNAPRGIATASDGSVYVADSGNHVIRRIAPGGVVSTIAGEPGVAGSDAHHLNTPAAVEVRDDGTLFIADTGNHAIRMLASDGSLVTIAGRVGVPGYADGFDSLFNGPVGLKFGPDGALYVADTSNQLIRKVVFTEPEPRRRAVRR